MKKKLALVLAIMLVLPLVFANVSFAAEEYFTVMFINWDGGVLSQQQVLRGEDAVEPEIPERIGYDFMGWDKDFHNVQSNLFIHSVWQLSEETTLYHVQFVDSIDGTILSDQDVVEGQAAIAPKPKEHEGLVFVGWSASFAEIKHHMQIFTVYEEAKPEGLLGDADLNEKVEAADATAILRHVAQLNTLEGQAAINADVDINNKIEAADATLVLRFVAGLITEF